MALSKQHSSVADLRSELPRALAECEILPYFQPIVDLQSERVIGFEVLSRWCHPTRQMVHPAEFIALAEEAGLIGQLTELVLSQACLAAADWPPEIELSVNISARQLSDLGMPERLHDVAEQAGFPLRRITFELTEGAVIEDFSRARAILGNLKSLGARIALDDFGTGHSGLRYLQLLPFDVLKLDASFVRSMAGHRESRKIVAAVMGLCQTLGLDSVAEGIELESQLEMLRCAGYRSGQGWLFGRPVPASHVAAILTDARRLTQHPESMAPIVEQVAMRLEAMPIQCLWQLRALYEGAPVGLAFVDRELRYIAVNEQLAEMHGMPIAAFLGRSVVDVIPELIDQIEPRYRRALAGEAVKDQTTYYRAHDHVARRVLRSSYQPVRDFADEVIGVSIAIVDITNQNADRVGRNPRHLQLPVFDHP